MEPENVFDILKEGLKDLLGDYTDRSFPSVQFDAINLGSDTPSEFDVTGLEVLVSPNFVLTSSPVINHRAQVTRELQVLVRQWTSGETTRAAAEKIVQLFPQASMGPTVPETRDHLEQVRISLYVGVDILAKTPFPPLPTPEE